MKTPTLLRLGLVLAGVTFPLFAFNTQAFVVTLQEQGALTGSISGSGGLLTINLIAADHWNVMVQDPRIGNPTAPPMNLAFIEPELVFGLTAYNNIQVLSVTPGNLSFDVLSDEFSPYSTIVPNGAQIPLQATDIEPVELKFIDHADSAPEPTTLGLLLTGGLVACCRCRSKRE